MRSEVQDAKCIYNRVRIAGLRFGFHLRQGGAAGKRSAAIDNGGGEEEPWAPQTAAGLVRRGRKSTTDAAFDGGTVAG